MRCLTHPALLATVHTSGAQWVAPTRIALGVLLLAPVDADIRQLLVVHPADPSARFLTTAVFGMCLRTLEIFSGFSFVVGFGTRLAGYPAFVLFAVRALANCAGSFSWLRDALSGVIVPHGDWGYGLMYLGIALLLGELLGAGSGCWSVDHWLARKLQAGDRGDSGR
ncbi:hypothetical protein J8I87_37605 [Paraburkholderia sp. LEh10]|uniref:hypothetical protein n=1 Tax=Paraburkholderia sp. LEh10 TaxID=2821353 RepID=UPI001AE8F17C|nr:hypothetical protein [Paraburkholderia sp. LEh10]MBP0595274.1 hypothetical protein [Paraburkholderia sp. LEh10]